MSEVLTPETIKKYEGKKLPELIEIAQKRVNKYVRLRDVGYNGEYFKCISCQKTKHVSQMNAGHFFAVGGFSSVRFNLDNIHGQCVYCNLHLNGNGAQYSYNLRRKIGNERFETLEKQAMISFKWDRLILIMIIEQFKDYK